VPLELHVYYRRGLDGQYGVDVSPELANSVTDEDTGEGLVQHKAVYLGV